VGAGRVEVHDFALAITMAVSLLDFSAEHIAGGVRLTWRTGSEIDCGAFEILRCDLSLSDCALVADHQALDDARVPCDDDPSGAGYQTIDDTAAPDRAYSYYLREHATTGGVCDYGPAVAEVGGDGGDDGDDSGHGPGLEDGGGGCGTSTGSGNGGVWLMLLALGALITRRKKQMTPDPAAGLAPETRPDDSQAAPPYEPPKLIVRDSDQFIRSLGPAQACSPNPFFP
jgi:MYXO-CTERM domain-containing protein